MGNSTTDTLRFVIKHQGEVKADLPIKQMGDEAPEYDRPWVETAKPAPLAETDVPQADIADATAIAPFFDEADEKIGQCERLAAQSRDATQRPRSAPVASTYGDDA